MYTAEEKNEVGKATTSNSGIVKMFSFLLPTSMKYLINWNGVVYSEYISYRFPSFNFALFLLLTLKCFSSAKPFFNFCFSSAICPECDLVWWVSKKILRIADFE